MAERRTDPGHPVPGPTLFIIAADPRAREKAARALAGLGTPVHVAGPGDLPGDRATRAVAERLRALAPDLVAVIVGGAGSTPPRDAPPGGVDGRGGEARARLGRLSAAEKRVLEMAAAGAANKQIAAALGLSLRTVERRRAEALAALGVETLAQAAAVLADARP